MITNTVHSYINIYNELKKPLTWKVPDKRVTMMVAANYVNSGKTFDLAQFQNIAEAIKSYAGFFSSIRSHPRFTIAALLDVNFPNPLDQVSNLFKYYKMFRKEKFRGGTFTYLAASVLLVNEHQDPLTIIQKAKILYDKMKKEHSILTTSADYPLATMLALEDRPNIIDHMEMIYQELSKNGFDKGNDLQFLSHILSLSNEENVQTLVNRCTSIYDSLKNIDIKPKRTYYPVIGILSLIPEKEVNIQEIKETYNLLMNEKDFRWQKDMNVMMAVHFFIKDKLKHSNLAETSIYTAIEAVIQAQQTVMIATIVGGSAAAASSSSNN